MKTFRNQAAQGDLLLRRIDRLPAEAKKVTPKNGSYVVAHSETGHHHTIEARPGVGLFTVDDPLISYLEVVEACDEVETILRHLRDFDTHEEILIPPGVYEIRRQREYVPEGWRRVED